MQLSGFRSKATWVLVLATLGRSPVVPLVKQFGSSIVLLVQKSWSLKTVVPAAVSLSSVHSMSGATTYVTSESANQHEGALGQTFSFAFMTAGNHKAFSYTVQGLPAGLSYNENANGPMISGTLQSVGSHSITIVGHRYAGKQGNETPPYSLSIKVSAAEQENQDSQSEVSSSENGADANESAESNSSLTPWDDGNTQALGNDWFLSTWFGNFFGRSEGWSYHLNHGWLYVTGSDESGFWLHDQNLGWLYTGKSLYPFLYRNSTSNWLYDQSTLTERKFWDYANNKEVSLQKN